MDYITPPSRSPAREFRCFGQLPAKLLRRCNLPEFVHFGSFSRKKLTYPSVDKSWIDSLSTCDNDNRREFLGRFEKAIATIFFSQGLGKCEEAGLEVTSVWEMLTSKPAAKYCSLKQGILHQLLDIISSSKEERLIRTSVYVLLVLISEDQSVIEDIKRKDLHLCCLARALKTNIQEAVILIYMLKPTPSEIKDLELLPSLVEIACNPHPGYKQATLSLPLSPTVASISMIEILVTAFDYVPPLVPPLFWKKKSSDSYLDTLKSSDFYMRKEKLRLISGHFEKFGLISDQKKSSDSYLVHLIKFRLFYDINPMKKGNAK